MDKKYVISVIIWMIAASKVDSFICPPKCKCTTVKNELYVSCPKAKMDHLPQGLPRNTVDLDMVKNKLHTITRDMFVNLTNLRTLSLFFNQLSDVAPDSFVDLSQLHTLRLGYNPFPNQNRFIGLLGELANNRNLTNLDLRNVHLQKKYTKDALSRLSKLPLETLDISKNNQAMPFPKFAFAGMSRLKVLFFQAMNDYHQPRDIDVMTFANMPALKNLSLDGNLFRTFPSFLINGTSILPNLFKLYLGHNQIRSLPSKDVGLSNLVELQLTENKITSLDLTINASFPSLLVLKLSMNHIAIPQYDKRILWSSTLQELVLNQNDIKIQGSNCKLFWALPNLRILNLDNNHLGQIGRSTQTAENLFRNCPLLEELSMQSTKIADLQEPLFQNLTFLRKLYVGGNDLKFINKAAFRPLQSLDSLYMDNNQIITINETSFPPDMFPRLRKVNFASNPFRCDCSLLWFLEWFNTTNTTIVGKKSPFSYRCNEPEKLKKVFFYQTNITAKSCTKLSLAVKLVIFISIPVAVVVVLSGFIIKYRWHIGYLYFLIRARRRQYREVADDTDYLFDAFVVYNNSELPWITEVLLPKLEEGSGLRLCLHDRNWLPGIDIVDNIVESIASSRKTLLIVSNAFATSQWCQLEMTMAQHRLLDDDRNALILVLLEELHNENITPRLALQLKTKTYIAWTENEVGKKLFWKKLGRAMNRPVGSIMNTNI